MDKHILLGNLTRDPDQIREADIGGKTRHVTGFTLAVNARDKVTYYRVTVFDKLAEIVVQYLHKGSKVCVEANSMRAHMYNTKSGETRADLECVAANIDFCDYKRGDADDAQFNRPAQAPASDDPVQRAMQHAMTAVPDEDLPF